MGHYIDVVVPRGGRGLGRKSAKIFQNTCNWASRGIVPYLSR